MIHIITAFCKNLGIGKDNAIPWYIPKDLIRFSNMTQNSTVIMGYNTWLSLPMKPLKNRKNIVITSKTDIQQVKDEIYISNPDDFEGDVYIIGGSKIYEYFIDKADKIHATYIDKKFDCDSYFPVFTDYEIESYEKHYSEEEKCDYYFITYQKSKNQEYRYLRLLENVMHGEYKMDRTQVGTKSLFAPDALRFDISKSLPLYTTKFVSWKAVLKELLWILKGQTDSKILEAQGVPIWKLNTTREFLDSRKLFDYEEGDTGPLYGSLRFYGCQYKGCQVNHIGEGIDQVSNIIESLKKDPHSRRHIMTTFNPAAVDQCVLYPCHGIVIQFYVSQTDLSCHVYIRSNDLFLGQPYNVTSYAMLTYIIGKKTGLSPKELVISFGDAHIYQNHFDQVNLQLTRKPYPFPVLEVSDAVATKDFQDITVDDFNVIGYLHHPSIKAEMAV